jgi:hypothetical protein
MPRSSPLLAGIVSLAVAPPALAEAWDTFAPVSSPASSNALAVQPRSTFFVVARGALGDGALRSDGGTLEFTARVSPHRLFDVGVGLDGGVVFPALGDDRFFISNLRVDVGVGGVVWTERGSQRPDPLRLSLGAGLDGYVPIGTGTGPRCVGCVPIDALGTLLPARARDVGMYLGDTASGRLRVAAELAWGPVTVGGDIGVLLGSTIDDDARFVALFQGLARASVLVGIVEPRVELYGNVGLSDARPTSAEQLVVAGGVRPTVMVPLIVGGATTYRVTFALELGALVERERRTDDGRF